MICPQCEEDLREGAVVCDGCGSPVADDGAAGALAAPDQPSPEASERVGKVLDDKYSLDSLLGEGGMGCVYRARRMHIGDEVAVKVLRRHYVGDARAVGRFRRAA